MKAVFALLNLLLPLCLWTAAIVSPHLVKQAAAPPAAPPAPTPVVVEVVERTGAERCPEPPKCQCSCIVHDTLYAIGGWASFGISVVLNVLRFISQALFTAPAGPRGFRAGGRGWGAGALRFE